MQRPLQIDQLASQLNDIVVAASDNTAHVSVGKTLDRETKERFFALFINSKTREVARAINKEIGDTYEDTPVRYRAIRTPTA